MDRSTELGALGVFPFMPVAIVLGALITGVVAIKVSRSQSRNTRIIADAQRYSADQARIIAELGEGAGVDFGKLALYAGLGIGGALLLSSLMSR